jgi:uroporphyrinogen decarboxylase
LRLHDKKWLPLANQWEALVPLFSDGVVDERKTRTMTHINHLESAATTLDIVEAPLASAHRVSNRQRFLRACHCIPVDRPPVWLMRQAGRCLPEYRALKEKYSFLQLVQTPELAAEVTLQPIRRFGFDAAILFSDILVVAEAMGQKYHFRDKGGIEMDFAITSAQDIERLEPKAVTERLEYTSRALFFIREALGAHTALLGFSGSPWTLANFMMEGGSAKEYTRAKQLFYSNPALFNQLSDKLSRGVINFLRLQIEAGVDAVQIFDSLGGLLSANAYERASARWIKQIIAELEEQVPVIVFAKGVHGNWDLLTKTRAQALGLDWTIKLADVARQLPDDIAVQGNLDPFLLTCSPEIVAAETDRLLAEMRGRDGYVFNLGHGVPPTARLESIEALVNTVTNFSNDSTIQ